MDSFSEESGSVEQSRKVRTVMGSTARTKIQAENGVLRAIMTMDLESIARVLGSF